MKKPHNNLEEPTSKSPRVVRLAVTALLVAGVSGVGLCCANVAELSQRQAVVDLMPKVEKKETDWYYKAESVEKRNEYIVSEFRTVYADLLQSFGDEMAEGKIEPNQVYTKKLDMKGVEFEFDIGVFPNEDFSVVKMPQRLTGEDGTVVWEHVDTINKKSDHEETL